MHTLTHTHDIMRVQQPLDTCTHTNTHTHTQTHTHTHTNTIAYYTSDFLIHMYAYTNKHTYMHACMQTYINACIHTYIHTYFLMHMKLLAYVSMGM